MSETKQAMAQRKHEAERELEEREKRSPMVKMADGGQERAPGSLAERLEQRPSLATTESPGREAEGGKQKTTTRSRKSLAPIKRRRTSDEQRVCHLNRHHLLMSCFLPLVLLLCCGLLNAPRWQAHCSPASSLSDKLRNSAGGGGAAGQIGDWLVHQVAPVVATRLIDNVLDGKRAKALQSDAGSSKPIDTHALADKIVDRLAESIKSKKSKRAKEGSPSDGQERSAVFGTTDAPTAAAAIEGSGPGAGGAKSSRRGKSLVGDSVQQVVQSLFSRDPQRTFFGRAMEKHAKHHGLRGTPPAANPQPAGSSWMMVREPSYESHLFVSTDRSKLDENPVVLRAEHGQNLTSTMPPPTVSYSQQQQQILRQQQYNKMKQQQQQQSYNSVHTNRHNQQQQLAPKPWQTGAGGRPRPQQSPYSLPVTSDMNIVQAPSSPAPATSTSTMPTSTATSTTSTSTTALPPTQHGAIYNQQHQITQLGSNKFKINNRHQQPSSTVAISPSSWYSSNHSSRYPGQQQHQSNYNHQHQHQHRYPMPSSTSSTTSTTTTTTSTTTTTTTTPEPQTEAMLGLMGNELEAQTSSPVSSILSSAAQTALEALGGSAQASGQMDDSNPYGSGYQPSNSSYFQQAAGSQSAAGTKGGALQTSTSARHSILSSEAIPTALGAPLYHQTQPNYTIHSLIGPLPPPRRSGLALNPATKALAQYVQKSMNSLSSTIFSRQSKSWARRLGLSSVLLSGLLYGAAVLSNPGAPLPSNGLEVLQALSKSTKKRRGSGALAPSTPLGAALAGSAESLLGGAQPNEPFGDIDRITNAAVLLDNNVNLLYQQQPHLISIIEQLIQQEQQQLQQQQQQQQQRAPGSALFSQRSMSTNPTSLDIESVQEGAEQTPEASARRMSISNGKSNVSPTSQQQATVYTLQALPAGQLYVPNLALRNMDQTGTTNSAFFNIHEPFAGAALGAQPRRGASDRPEQLALGASPIRRR